MTRRFLAPGKVVVLGEYAVLDGAPALVAAVDLGVAVAVAPAVTTTVSTPTGDTRFVDAALAATRPPPATWTFQDHGGDRLASKPGLGGSAAATVVAVYAARALRGEDLSPAPIFHVAAGVHHAVQGSGSGVDVAACTWGGMTRFVLDATPTPAHAHDVLVIYTGQSAQTGPRVAQYQAWSGREAFVADSTALVDGFDADPIATLEAARLLLEAMAESAGIAYRTPSLDRIGALARAHGGAAKPSGAGGGDSAVALVPPGARDPFTAALTKEGFTVLATQLSPGVREA